MYGINYDRKATACEANYHQEFSENYSRVSLSPFLAPIFSYQETRLPNRSKGRHIVRLERAMLAVEMMLLIGAAEFITPIE